MNENLVFRESTWGDVEIMAASAILETDIYVANNFYRIRGSSISEIRWSLLRAANYDCNHGSIYITNFHCHYEPVRSMINSSTSTYGMKLYIDITDNN